jgi:hypothetical protein
MLVVERNFAEFSGEIARDNVGKRHEPSLWVGRHGEAALEGTDAVSSAVGLMKTTVGLMKMEAIEFSI